MKHYQVTVTGDKYPTDYVVQAGSWNGAAAKGIKEWRKRFRGSRSTTLSVRIVKGI